MGSTHVPVIACRRHRKGRPRRPKSIASQVRQRSRLRRGQRRYSPESARKSLSAVHAPTIDHVELVSRGDVRRAKLYYLRGLRGKAARIREKREN